MSGGICANGEALACFVDGPNLILHYQTLDNTQKQISRILMLNPRDLFAAKNNGNVKDKEKDSSAEESKVSESESTSAVNVTETLTCVSLSNDAQFLATADTSKTIFILSSYNPSSEWRPLTSFQLERRKFVALKFTQDNKSLAMVDKAGEVYLADLSTITTSVLSPDNPKKLLGHCSYITDMILLSGSGSGGDGSSIITCDRDAKIRQSFFPEAFITHRYFLGNKKSIVGIAAVCFEKALLSVASDGECMLWSLQKADPEEDEDGLLMSGNLLTHTAMGELLGGTGVNTVEAVRVSCRRSKTLLGIKLSNSSSPMKLFCIFELSLQPGTKGWTVHLLESWKHEYESSTPLDFVLIEDCCFEYFSKGHIVESRKIKAACIF